MRLEPALPDGVHVSVVLEVRSRLGEVVDEDCQEAHVRAEGLVTESFRDGKVKRWFNQVEEQFASELSAKAVCDINSLTLRKENLQVLVGSLFLRKHCPCLRGVLNLDFLVNHIADNLIKLLFPEVCKSQEYRLFDQNMLLCNLSSQA